MRYLTLITLSMILPGQSQAANEWKNPDLIVPKNKQETAAQLPEPVPVIQTLPEGHLGLSTKRICEYQLSYKDKGSGGKIDGSFFSPDIPDGYSMIGSYAQGNYHAPTDCVLAVKPENSQSSGLLQAPRNWQRVWTDKGSGANKDGSIWHPVASGNDYICLGSVATEGYKQPSMQNYACVHRCLTENVPATHPVWSTRGTGAKQDIYIYKLHNSNSFYAISDKSRPDYLRDIKGRTSCQF